MKYIKTFESKLELKKYIIYKEDQGLNMAPVLYIFEPISVKNNVLKYYRICLYRIEDNFLYNYKEDREQNNKKADINKAFYDVIKENIIFQSNSLEECIEMIPILAKSEKYNI